MKKLKIICRTDNGIKAVQQHIAEFHSRKNIGHRMVYKRLVSQDIISFDPYIFEITIKNPTFASLVKPKYIQEEIQEAMKKNGAELDIDYIMDVE